MVRFFLPLFLIDPSKVLFEYIEEEYIIHNLVCKKEINFSG